MELLGISIGWILIVLGALFLLIEATNPGFFIAVPGTVMIILGVLFVLGVDVFGSTLGVIVGVVTALAAAIITVWLYSRITPDENPPTTLSRDSVVGLEGLVTKEVEPESIRGKVTIEGVEWSARSADGTIQAGARVVVVRSEGVHIVVEEMK
ncbi:membrane-bound ClpP family serine protease [Methanofollis sp. W23]|uniref:NfeD family protein n=1 Tax=Methanofollis sp. W23 TaxID=2817849 RepID=UPI001AE70D86|nr:NfeD family protein [Methanofollis sp. W23]MBP2146065.1 membrane-bound ClpP family serine protease [Methanofollis sp. W23]